MNRLTSVFRRVLLCAAFALPVAAQADPVPRDVFFGGAGSLVFDAGTGTGAWLGTLDESTFPAVPAPLSLLSSVSFMFDAATGHLQGSFEFTDATDLASTLTGDISGDLLSGDFAGGGQLSLDLGITGGTGVFSHAAGFGLSLLDFTAPVGGFYDYTEAGVMSFTVPEPGSLALVATCLLGLAVSRRKAAPVNWSA